MFKYEELTEKEKEFLEILGDHTKSQPIEPYIGIKSLKQIYEDYYDKRMTYEDLIKLTDGLYFHGLISYSPTSVGSVNNIKESARELLENNFGVEKMWRDQRGFIRLTTDGERSITGTDIYFQIIKEDLSKQFSKLQEVISNENEIREEFTEIKKQLDNSIVKNIEVLTIFIAIIAIIGGNISVFSNFQFTGISEIISVLLITIVILLFVIMSLFIMVKRIVIGDTKGKLIDDFKNIIFSVILVLLALLAVA